MAILNTKDFHWPSGCCDCPQVTNLTDRTNATTITPCPMAQRGFLMKTENFAVQFEDVATIHDKRRFNARIAHTIEQALERRQSNDSTLAAVSPFRAEKRWTPTANDLQRGRALLLKEFRQSHNLPVVAFAALAGKSRQQVYKDIEMRRLLSLSIGAGGQRIPDWQLDETKRALIQAVLERASDLDDWTLYRALSTPNDALSSKVPIDAVTPGNLPRVLKAILAQLGLQG